MPKKRKQEEKTFDMTKYDQHMRKQSISDMLDLNYMPYAMSVIISRALPDVRDGFKPSQRKVLYTMKKMNLRPGHKSKSANIAGSSLKLNPHSDQSCYETMVRMVDKNETLLAPYVEGKGSFGKHYSRDMAFAASRYTEASLSKLGMELFNGIDKNAIDMMDNYDGTLKEPTVLPVSFPAILANTTLGVAVGFASNICSFNLSELCQATIEYIKHPRKDLLDIMPAPDFPTGGEIIYDKEEMRQIYNTGRGSIKVRSRYVIDRKNHTIEIKEIPYSTTAEAIVESIINLCKKSKIKEINDIRDDTDKNGLTITIDYKRSCDPDQLMLKLFKLTPLEDTYSCNFNVIVNGNPKCLGVYNILTEWIEFRKTCISRMLTYDLNNKKKERHLLTGLQKILINLNKVIRIIKNTEKDENVVPNLMDAFKLDQEQAEYVANIKLRNINKDYLLTRTEIISQLNSEIIQLEKILASESEIKKIIIKDLRDIIKKYGIERKSILIHKDDIKELDEIEKKEINVKVYITDQGYIKKIPKDNIKNNSEIKLKDKDFIIQEFDDNNQGELLVFTNQANVYKMNLSDIKEHNKQEFGDFISTLLNINSEEKIIKSYCTNQYNEDVIIVFEDGKVARFPLKAYQTKTNRKMLKNAFYNKKNILFIDIVPENKIKYYMLETNHKKLLIFTNDVVSLKASKLTQGIQICRLVKEHKIIKCVEIQKVNKKITNCVPKNYPATPK